MQSYSGTKKLILFWFVASRGGVMNGINDRLLTMTVPPVRMEIEGKGRGG
jgi:hypothetical protein